ncbi:MAG TPA: bifunctional glutamate N-acetyltransferase/amino-acid acetyltransferase ArgJ [Candidatus Omnitrophota bacterium]|nr:bifunctional glutamate N-acetyltransferase/amino-acid acetyltransferase ArgJ [Candidatus Omnitrophota bacterium]
MKKKSSETAILPAGFLAAGIHCGAKRKRKDLSLIYSEKPCTASALFTRNTVKAAPVIRGIAQIKRKASLRAVLVNSGNANCMTGERGLKDCEKMADSLAHELGLKAGEVFVSSTGIIGQYMNMKPILKGLKPLVESLSRSGVEDAADGIITTDGFRKISSRKFMIKGRQVTITGIAKGAGMIKPEMATMLAYIMTDAVIDKRTLDKTLSLATDISFNAITVDGDMSTNDTVLVMANGMAGNERISGAGVSAEVFRKNLAAVMEDLSGMIVRDGEGASKFIKVNITGARTHKDAKKVAESVADSLLVKCAIAGGDPNWGRIASSAGASGVKFDPGKMTIKLDNEVFFRKGKPVPGAKRINSPVFKGRDVKVEVDLAEGPGKAVFYSCDITTKYITLNSFYTT